MVNVVVGVSQTAADLLGFSQHRSNLWDFTQDGPAQGKHLASGRCVQENASLMSEVKGQRVRMGRETTETNNSNRCSNNHRCTQCEPNKVTSESPVSFLQVDALCLIPSGRMYFFLFFLHCLLTSTLKS